MKALIVNYRSGYKTQTANQYILEVEGIKTKAETEKLRGKTVVWKTSKGKPIVGKIVQAHGNKGAVRARFNKGLPGQAIGTKVEISA
ncbi:MAG TPA: 50S ribosomal protein L35ae [Candidatus Diapherotrites archaeon]|uniref:Large ribosomal subunit protein eL33 n=1 Tax=Candidatus Iainarchaeum sp. TaxID=3101447 RepID=A0A7J4JXT3_9ARCH|nr:50S ribosomal protein L35ae [Candidatus Diapherotrites archaeon]